jgi:hypothetical protein
MYVQQYRFQTQTGKATEVQTDQILDLTLDVRGWHITAALDGVHLSWLLP